MTANKTLSDPQQAAVDSSARLRLVVAGPGSGKTKTLVAAVAMAAAERGADKCCVVTYTNAAADEVERRLAAMGIVGLVFVGTLHALCLSLIQKRAPSIGLPRVVSVADDDQKVPLLESIMADMGEKVSERKLAATLLKPEIYCEPAPRVSRSRSEVVAIEYYRRLREAGLLDFDMVLYYGLKAVELGAGPWPFTDLFVDEFQDSADADFVIYRAMPCERKFYCGDPDQAIYGFRGGNVANILSLAETCENPKSGAEVFRLEDNYRSTPSVCEAAQLLIERNAGRVDKATRSVRNDDHCEIFAKLCETPIAEQCFVGDRLNLLVMHEGVLGYDDCAVLARTNKLAGEHAEFLKARGVPVKERKWKAEPRDWRKAKLLLSLMANPFNDLVAYQFTVLQLGKAAADVAKQSAAMEMKSIFEWSGGDNEQDLNLRMGKCGISFESRERVHDACRRMRSPWTLPELVLYLNAREEERETEGEGVFVGTFHAAKGREWGAVFMVGCEQGTIPSKRSLDDPTSVEEERRLFYVAMTRAKDKLFVTHCAARPTSRGPNLPPGPPEPRQPSQFIAEAGL